MSGIDHIFLYSLAFFLLLYFSIKNDKCHTRKEVFKLFIPSALFYALIEALRYDRGVDYLHYKDIYEVGYFVSGYIDEKDILRVHNCYLIV